jgi:hypothetical protein
MQKLWAIYSADGGPGGISDGNEKVQRWIVETSKVRGQEGFPMPSTRPGLLLNNNSKEAGACVLVRTISPSPTTPLPVSTESQLAAREPRSPFIGTTPVNPSPAPPLPSKHAESKVVNQDLTNFFAKWKWPIDAATRSTIAGLNLPAIKFDVVGWSGDLRVAGRRRRRPSQGVCVGHRVRPRPTSQLHHLTLNIHPRPRIW